MLGKFLKKQQYFLIVKIKIFYSFIKIIFPRKPKIKSIGKKKMTKYKQHLAVL